MKIAVLASHPIQYHAPLFRQLSERSGVGLEVWYGSMPNPTRQGADFGVAFEWDIPLLEGYVHKVTGHGSNYGPVSFAATVLKVMAEIRRFAPDVLLNTGWYHPSLVAGLAAGLATKTPLILRTENNLLRKRSWFSWMAQGPLLKLHSAHLAIGIQNRKYLIRNGVDPQAVYECPYFVDNRRFSEQSARTPKAEVRDRFGIPENHFCFVYSGKLIAKKHPLDALLAFATAGLTNSTLIFIGDGQLRQDIESEAASRDVSIKCLGFVNQSEMPAVLGAGDCLLLPSDEGETWGLVVNEAMACGLPCIVSDRVGCREDLIVEGVTGYSHPCGDIDALARLMRHVVDRPELTRELGLAARARVMNNYTVEKAADGILQAADFVVSRQLNGFRKRA